MLREDLNGPEVRKEFCKIVACVFVFNFDDCCVNASAAGGRCFVVIGRAQYGDPCMIREVQTSWKANIMLPKEHHRCTARC